MIAEGRGGAKHIRKWPSWWPETATVIHVKKHLRLGEVNVERMWKTGEKLEVWRVREKKAVPFLALGGIDCPPTPCLTIDAAGHSCTFQAASQVHGEKLAIQAQSCQLWKEKTMEIAMIWDGFTGTSIHVYFKGFGMLKCILF